MSPSSRLVAQTSGISTTSLPPTASLKWALAVQDLEGLGLACHLSGPHHLPVKVKGVTQCLATLTIHETHLSCFKTQVTTPLSLRR